MLRQGEVRLEDRGLAGRRDGSLVGWVKAGDRRFGLRGRGSGGKVTRRAGGGGGFRWACDRPRGGLRRGLRRPQFLEQRVGAGKRVRGFSGCSVEATRGIRDGLEACQGGFVGVVGRRDRRDLRLG